MLPLPTRLLWRPNCTQWIFVLGGYTSLPGSRLLLGGGSVQLQREKSGVAV